MVPRARIELARPCGHRFLRPTRLPVPPPRRTTGGSRPYHWPMRFALTALLISILTACGPNLGPSAVASPTDTPATTIVSGPRTSEPPISPPTPPGTPLPAFACADAAGGKTGVANTIAARGAAQPGYDRFVLQMDSIVPEYTVKRQATATFTQGASGQTV